MSTTEEIVSVSRLVHLLKEVVEDNFVRVTVAGEVSNFSAPTSGHYYFGLKDASAQIRGVMFRSNNRMLDFQPENGMQVVCEGRISVYAQRGELQLVVERMQPAGVGNWQQAFEQLKRKLDAEGLFNAERKRPLPPFPRIIGVVTSPTGAAIHDILNVLRRRGAGLLVLLRPVRVQGDGAAEEIAQAVADLNAHGQADVLIVGRGGGSPEDLWAFNEEVVARALFASRIPVISAVGHEVDVTISDLVADLRAPTPSAAAEVVVRGRQELERHVDHLIMRLSGQMQSRLSLLKEKVTGLQRRLRSPGEALRLRAAALETLQKRLTVAMDKVSQTAANRFRIAHSRLHALSPQATLERGYAIVFMEQGASAVRDAGSLHPGEKVRIRLAKGHVKAQVEQIER